jgi:PKD repeat protein
VPPNPTQQTTATFAWTTTGQVDTTTCQLDGGTPQNCTTPRTYTNLSVGVHTFTVTVANAGGSDSEVYTWEITPPQPVSLCSKIEQLLQIANNFANVDVEVTFSGVQASTSCQSVPQWNRTYLFPGAHFPAGACPTVNVGATQSTQVCGTIIVQGNTPTIGWRICMACTGNVAVGPMLEVRATYPDISSPTGAIGAEWNFVSRGAQLEPLIDQLLATGVGVVPFHSQFNPPIGGQQFDFSNATCTLRIFN